MTPFRERPKKTLRLQVPPELRKAFKRTAEDAEMSDSEFGVRILCSQLGYDVESFGLDPTVLLPSPAHA